jgi:hypothetical protein
MSLLWAVRHYTGALAFNQVQRCIARWEKISKFTEWGYYWDGGWLLEIDFGNGPRFVHMKAFAHSAEPWEDESRVTVEFLEDGEWPIGYDWEPYPLERTHRWVTKEGGGHQWQEL